MNPLDTIIYVTLKYLLLFLGQIPPSTASFFSRYIARIWFRLDGKHRKITLGNLRQAYGETMGTARTTDLAAAVFENTIKMLFEYAWFYGPNVRYNARYFKVKGFSHLLDARKKNKGVLALTAHMGNWELAAALCPIAGIPVTVVYRKIKSGAVDRLVRENRQRLGLSVYPLRNAFKGVTRALHDNQTVGLLMDQNTGHDRGVFIDFFGRKACANPGLSKLALESGAPVVPIFGYRENNHFIIEIQQALPLIKTGDVQRDIHANTQLQNNAIEAVVRRYPAQWFWMHNRWKTRPKTTDAKETTCR